MYLVDENYQPLSVEDVKAYLLNLDDVEDTDEETLDAELGSYYAQALQIEASKRNFQAQFLTVSAEGFFPGIGSILDSIRRFICNIIKETSTRDEIIDAILDAISGIIPGGILLKPILKKLVKYILNLGFDGFCPVLVTA
jgi:hypothetical protein